MGGFPFSLSPPFLTGSLAPRKGLVEPRPRVE